MPLCSVVEQILAGWQDSFRCGSVAEIELQREVCLRKFQRYP